jgi:hypothetical protein
LQSIRPKFDEGGRISIALQWNINGKQREMLKREELGYCSNIRTDLTWTHPSCLPLSRRGYLRSLLHRFFDVMPCMDSRSWFIHELSSPEMLQKWSERESFGCHQTMNKVVPTYRSEGSVRDLSRSEMIDALGHLFHYSPDLRRRKGGTSADIKWTPVCEIVLSGKVLQMFPSHPT